MTSAKEVERLLRREVEPHRRLRAFAAMLGEESGLGTGGLMVVGGSAIEIYTDGGYVSGDIDLLVADRGKVEPLLKAWGFKHEGKLWTHDRLGLFVDLLGSENSGSNRLTRVVQTKYGKVRLGAIEDLLLKRLREVRYWSIREALAQAALLARLYTDEIDWTYVNFYAKQDGLEDLVAVLRGIEPARKRK
jgi:hypothetical protein